MFSSLTIFSACPSLKFFSTLTSGCLSRRWLKEIKLVLASDHHTAVIFWQQRGLSTSGTCYVIHVPWSVSVNADEQKGGLWGTEFLVVCFCFNNEKIPYHFTKVTLSNVVEMGSCFDFSELSLITLCPIYLLSPIKITLFLESKHDTHTSQIYDNLTIRLEGAWKKVPWRFISDLYHDQWRTCTFPQTGSGHFREKICLAGFEGPSLSTDPDCPSW